MIKTILAYILNIALEAIKKELNNELVFLEDAIITEKDKLEKVFEGKKLNIGKKREQILKILEVIK